MTDLSKATRVQMHKSGPEFSSVIWGSMRCEEQFSSVSELADHLRFLLDQGVTTLDTAPAYGIPDPYTVEEFLGKAIKQVGRDKFEIVTKLGIQRISPHRDVNRVRHFDFSAKEIARSTARSLEILDIDQIDLILLHRPDYLMIPAETGGALDKLVADGNVKHVGVSNFSPSRIALLKSELKAPITTNQIEFSPLFLDPISNGTFDTAIMEDHRPMIWSPVGGGRLLTSDDEMVSAIRAKLTEIAKAYNLDGPAEAAMSFVVRHPVGGVPIVGSGKRERMTGAIKAVNTAMDIQDWYDIVAVTSPSLSL